MNSLGFHCSMLYLCGAPYSLSDKNKKKTKNRKQKQKTSLKWCISLLHKALLHCPLLSFLYAAWKVRPRSPRVAWVKAPRKGSWQLLLIFFFHLECSSSSTSYYVRAACAQGSCPHAQGSCPHTQEVQGEISECAWQGLRYLSGLAAPCSASSSLSISTRHSRFGNKAIFYHQLHTFFLLCSWLYNGESEPRQQATVLRWYFSGN